MGGKFTPEAIAAGADPSIYTWSSFFSIMTGHASPAERESYFNTRDILNEKTDCKRCNDNKKWLFKNSPTVRFLQAQIDLLGNDQARITENNVKCRRCGPGQAWNKQTQKGGFSSEYGILLCANELQSRGIVEDTLAHEMVHAYDHMRFHLDPYDLRHAACMEIRASTLSGECRFFREFFKRKQYNLTQQLQECVRRRATLSVASRPACKDDVHAARVVNEVWEGCFNDTRPFDEIYR